MPGNALATCRLQTVLGRFTLIADNVGMRQLIWKEELPEPQVHAMGFADQVFLPTPASYPTHPALLTACKWLIAYSNRECLPAMPPIHLTGTDFQLKVWNRLLDIPYRQTITYGYLACQIGSPQAARAIGCALHRNPLPLLLPCHRVVAAHGMGGYALGLSRKALLLQLEGTAF